MSVIDISQPGGLGMLPIILLLIYVLILGIIVYFLILLIKLAHRGIKVLDLYINKNNHND